MKIDLKILIKNGVHFGHQKSKRNPKMDPYIWGYKNNIHLIDVSKTAFQMEKAATFLESVAAKGMTVFWVGTKKAAHESIDKAAAELNNPFVRNRWVGGTCTNYRQIRKAVKNFLDFKDVLSKSEQFPYNKKELSLIQKKADRLEKNVGGIVNLTWPIGAIVVVDVKKEHVCIKEALAVGIPVVALVDTNSDPSGIAYVIPSNDDAPRSINVIMDYLIDAVKRGQEASAAYKPEEAPISDSFEHPFDPTAGLEEEEEENSEKKASRTAGAAPVRTAKKQSTGVAKQRTGGGVRRDSAPFSRTRTTGDKTKNENE
jgi:small subunit ribosomal protein S2